MNNNYDLNNENKIGNEGNNNFVGSTNNDLVNNLSNNSNNLGNYNQTFQNDLNNNGTFGNMPYNSANVSNSVNLKDDKKKSKTGFIIAMIVIAIILLSWGAKILVSVFATKQVSSTISTARLNSIVEQYRVIEKNVKMFAIMEQPVTCNSDCYNIYDYDKERYDVKVIDKNAYYQIEFKVIGETYKGINLDSDKCQDLSNATCNGNEITGKVYKISE